MADHSHTPHDHAANEGHGHGHSHGRIDPSIATSERGIWAVRWSFIILIIAASIQLAIVILSNSVGLLADTIHNFADAGTAIPLGLAFLLAKRKANKRFSYGYGRFEDFAGVVVVLIILASAAVAAYVSIRRLITPQPVTHLWAIAAASIIGFLGNEAVAIFRIKIGKEIGSAALIADGYHARTDGWTSLAVLAGALGVYFGFPKADPIIGLLITTAILVIVWQSAKDVLVRALDGVEPDVLKKLKDAATHVAGVQEVAEIRARWLGHQLLAELNIAVSPEMSVAQAHKIATEVHGELLARVNFLARAVVHVDPVGSSGEDHHLEESAHHEPPTPGAPKLHEDAHGSSHSHGHDGASHKH